jgi:hypothetical protein
LYPSDEHPRPVVDEEKKNSPCEEGLGKLQEEKDECISKEEYEKPSFTAKFYVNNKEVTEEEFDKAVKTMQERREKFLSDDWLLRNILGF